jgi:hypothetical protein
MRLNAAHAPNKLLSFKLYNIRFEDIILIDLTPEYERFLMKELFNLRTVVGFTFDEIIDMPIQERRFYMLLHNQRIQEEMDRANGQEKWDSNMNDVQALVAKRNEANQKNNGI